MLMRHVRFLVYLLALWLPVQNSVLALLTVFFALSNDLSIAVAVLKELIVMWGLVLLVVGTKIDRNVLKRVDRVLVLYILINTVYLVLPSQSSGFTAKVFGYRLIVLPALLYLLGRFLPFSEKNLMRFVQVIILTGVFVAAYGPVERFVFPDEWMRTLMASVSISKGYGGVGLSNLYMYAGSIFDLSGIILVRRSVSTYLDPLTAGHALALPTLLVFGILFSRGLAPIRSKGLILMSLGLLLWAEWLIISRGAWAVIAIGVVVMLRFLDPLKRFSKPVVLLSIVIVLALPQTRNTLINLITLQGPSDLLQDPSLRQHSRQFTLNVVTIISNPFGHGLGAASYASSLGSSTVGWHANESFFGALAQQTGWIPLALFLLFLFSICQLCYRALERPRGSPMQRLVLMVVLGASMGYAFSAVFSEAAYGMLSSAMYWILTGVAVQIAYQPQSALERNK